MQPFLVAFLQQLHLHKARIRLVSSTFCHGWEETHEFPGLPGEEEEEEQGIVNGFWERGLIFLSGVSSGELPMGRK